MLRLPVVGTAPLMVPAADLSDEETRVVSRLHHGSVQAYRGGRPSPGAWVAFFKANYLEDQNTHVVAFLAVWLDQFVFSSSWKGRYRNISPRVFSIVARLVCVSHLALAPAYLGTLYWRLDQFSQDLQHSCGFSEVVSMVDVGPVRQPRGG